MRHSRPVHRQFRRTAAPGRGKYCSGLARLSFPPQLCRPLNEGVQQIPARRRIGKVDLPKRRQNMPGRDETLVLRRRHQPLQVTRNGRLIHPLGEPAQRLSGNRTEAIVGMAEQWKQTRPDGIGPCDGPGGRIVFPDVSLLREVLAGFDTRRDTPPSQAPLPIFRQVLMPGGKNFTISAVMLCD